VETPETPESLAGLKYLKEKIVAAMNKNGVDADINSPEIHAKAIEMRASLDKKGQEAREKLQAMGKVLKNKPDKFWILWAIAYVLGYSLIGFAIILLVAWLCARK
jgi:hypothetical protein